MSLFRDLYFLEHLPTSDGFRLVGFSQGIVSSEQSARFNRLQALVSAPAGLAQPERYRQGGYVRRLPEDPWGNPYRYRRQSTHGQPFDVFSLGADGKEGGEGNDADLGNWQG